MRAVGQPTLVAVVTFVGLLNCCTSVSRSSWDIVEIVDHTVFINIGGIRTQVYPPLSDVVALDPCPNAPWKNWKLHRVPPDYNPMHWNMQEWKEYLLHYPLASAGLSLAFFLIGFISLAVFIVWRCVQLCVSCGRCRYHLSVGAESVSFLGDIKHAFLKVWTYVLIVAALGMVVWGMIAMDKQLLVTFWNAVSDVLDYGTSVSKGMTHLQDQMDAIIPSAIEDVAFMVKDTLRGDVLADMAEDAINHVMTSQGATDSLLSGTTAIRSGLQTTVLPGMAALAAQLGVRSARRRQMQDEPAPSYDTLAARRRRMQDEPAPSYDTLADLVWALHSSMPLVMAASTIQDAMRLSLQRLQAALERVQIDGVAGPDAQPVVDLDKALHDTTPTHWDKLLGELSTALQVYNSSRSATAFNVTASAADSIVAGAALLADAAAKELVNNVSSLGLQVQGPALHALQALAVQLHNISQQLMDINGWTVQLENGTSIPVLVIIDRLLDYFDELAPPDNITPHGRVESIATAFVEGVLNSSRIASDISASAASLSTTASAAADTAGGGPDPSPAHHQIDTVLRTALSDIADPVAAVIVALATYSSDPNVTNLATLRAAAAKARGPVSIATEKFSLPLVNGSELAVTATDLHSAAVIILATSSDLNATLDDANHMLDSICVGDLAPYEHGLGALASLMKMIPGSGAVAAALEGPAKEVRATVDDLAERILNAIAAMERAIGSAVLKLKDHILEPADTVSTKVKSSTDKIMDIVYPVIMGFWSLAALLLLLVALSVWRNWPAGLLAFGVLMLIYIILTQVAASVLAFAMAVLEDACDNLEPLVMRGVVESQKQPIGATMLSVILSYYFYHKPATQDLMIQAAVALNVTALRSTMLSLDDSLVQPLEDKYRVQGEMKSLLANVTTLATSVVDMFDGILGLVEYEDVNPLYLHTKATVCCGAGNVAYREWCALTAMATLSFAALAAAAYLLARMDMVRERRGRCSCCTCACYKPYHQYMADESTGAGHGVGRWTRSPRVAVEDLRLPSKETEGRRRVRMPDPQGEREQSITVHAEAVIGPIDGAAAAATSSRDSSTVALAEPSAPPMMAMHK